MFSSIIDHLIFIFATSTTLMKFSISKWIATLLICGRILYWLVPLTVYNYKRNELMKSKLLFMYFGIFIWLIYLCIYDTDDWLIYPCIATIISLITISYLAFKSEKISVKIERQPQPKKPKKQKTQKPKFDKSKNSLNFTNVKLKNKKGDSSNETK
ncbi:hypothetical protein OFO10_04885 [Campylobacter sp. VBCF_06 NA8]|uniref:hypothetical protein n=1 Tax=Campylobacter sp. VBCF_06 NA8 TaxID=2983822 RepID=UPI0022EA03E1|nr:hypothetical protein [Campylobacter sp. VBCF_06 NA8]MDA3046487.1 hypothetical protein [Campylobacter sp. VBCF_06 NA8]